MNQVAFREAPSLFHCWPKDAAFAAAAWIGIVLACLTITGLADRAILWILFNLIPNWQLDGGRGFRALTRKQRGDRSGHAYS